ncbi:hypothetical protein QEH56_23920 [Pelagicoccus enzymogenes]|uniref:hypothetical protein n=1 Tax=Pelagicoccus enzymogenes TaxID=2773457 RepID=UPI00280DB892|nr:hypothetical protein [Pelagicoccus enzymogenes]MDQ8201233.1 hypothetical protein [Pelagicoccus enzymogenes]
MDKRSQVRKFATQFLEKIRRWEKECSERMEAVDSGKLTSDNAWELIKNDAREIKENFCVGETSDFSGESFSLVSGYSIEEIRRVEVVSKGEFYVFTERLRPKILQEGYRYRVIEMECGTFKLSSREYYSEFEDTWEQFSY